MPKVAVAPSGATVMVWPAFKLGGDYTLLARRMSARGRLGRVRTLAVERNVLSDSLDLQLAVDAAGSATVAWNRVVGYPAEPKGHHLTEATVRVRRFSADGSLGRVVDIPSDGGLSFSPRLAVEPSGRGAITWVRSADDRHGVRGALIRRNGRLGTVRDVSIPGQYWSGGAAEVAMDARGRATVTWVALTDLGQTVAARQLSAGGLGPLHTLSPTTWVHGPSVAVDARGTATVAWREVRPVPRSDNLIEARQIRAGGMPGPLRRLSPPSAETSAPQLAADRLGNTTVVWAARPRPFDGPAFVQARRFTRGGRLGAVRTLNLDRTPSLVGQPQVVADTHGVVTVAWSVHAVRTRVIRATRFRPRR